ncbi:MAG TPA: hypothetical protein V6D05_02240 [Stenomitos sp.]
MSQHASRRLAGTARAWACTLALLLTLLVAPAWAAEAVLRLEYSPLAPAGDVHALQAEAAEAWLGTLYVSMPEDLRPKVQLISLENLEHGVAFHLEVAGSDQDRERAAAIARDRLASLAKDAQLRYAYNLTTEGQPAPAAPKPMDTTPYWVAGGVAVAGLGLMAYMLFRRSLFLSLPFFHGLPVLGILPAGIGMGGRFLELQSPPSQALGVFFRRLTAKLNPGVRETAVFSLSNLDASAAVTACLAIALLRERGRVLVVDLAGEESSLPAILEETDDAGDFPIEGTLRSTSIADLDLLTGLKPLGARRPPLPPELLARYRWVLYHAPLGEPLERTRHVLVLSTGEGRKEALRGRYLTWWHQASLLGAALVGVEVPPQMRDTLMARFYYEKLQAQEASA